MREEVPGHQLSYEQIMGLSPWDFDQSPLGWRQYEEINPLAAARLIARYIKINPGKIPERVMALFNFHRGQLLACAGREYWPEAIKSLENSLQDNECWNAYVSATIGFLEVDIYKIESAINTIQNSKEPDKGVGNIKIVENLKLSLERGVLDYKQAYLLPRS